MLVKPSYEKTRDLIEKVSLPDDEPGKLLLEFPIQRPAGQWNNEKKGRLIHAVLMGDPIPPLYIANSGDDISPQMLLDGVQRVTTMVEYVCGDEGKRAMKLWNKTPDVEIPKYDKDENGNTVQTTQTIKLAGKTFKQLPKEAQRLIQNYKFDCKVLSDYTNEDLARIMYNLNNGITATATQKAVMKLGMDVGAEIKKLTESDLFEDNFLFTSREEKGSEAHKCVLYSLIQWTGQEYDDFNYGKLTGTALNTLIDKYAHTWTKTHFEGIQNIFDTLNNILPDNEESFRPYMKSTHLPIWVMNVDKYLEMLENNEITEQQYRNFLDLWFTKGVNSKEFQALAVEDGRNISAKSNIEARIDLMDTALDNFLATGDLGLTYAEEMIFTEEDTFEKSESEIIEETENANIQEVSETEIPEVVSDNAISIKDCISYIQSTLNIDKLTAVRSILYSIEPIYCQTVEDFDANLKLLTDTEISDMITKSVKIADDLSKCGLSPEEIPSFFAVYYIADLNGSTHYYSEWVNEWCAGWDADYMDKLDKYDNTAQSRGILTLHLENKFKEYCKFAESLKRGENTNVKHTA